MGKKLFLFLLILALLIISLSFYVYPSFQISLTGHAITQICSGTPASCSYPNANSCNNRAWCSWIDGSCQVDVSCSDFSSELSCTEAGCTWEVIDAGSGDGSSTTTTSSGGATIQKTIKISPRFPLAGDTLYQGKNELKVVVYYGEDLTDYAKVYANSSMFGLVELKRSQLDSKGVYSAEVIINENVSLGEQRIFFQASYLSQFDEIPILVNVQQGLNIEIKLEEKYYKGEKIVFSGTVFDLNESKVSNAVVNIRGLYGDFEGFSLETMTDNDGNFSVEKTIPYGQMAGTWNIEIIAESPDEKRGIKALSIEIDFPLSVSYYSVNFLSPLKDKTFRRGDTIPISIEVKDENGNPITNAKVTVHCAKGEECLLKESTREEGIYSENIEIPKDINLGKWFIEAEVSKQQQDFTKYGGASISIITTSAEILFNPTSLDKENLYTNSRLKLNTYLKYPDGSIVTGVLPKAVLSNGEIIGLIETKKGFYEGNYFIKVDDAGTMKVVIEAEDFDGNLAFFEKKFAVIKRSYVENFLGLIYDFFLRYLWIFLILVLVSGYILMPFAQMKILLWRMNKLKGDTENIKIERKDLEKKFYEGGSISKTEFESLKSNYGKKIEDKETRIKELREVLSNKIYRFGKRN